MTKHQHEWEPWRSAADQLGALFPDKGGIYWRYKSRCNIMGCNAVRYAESLAVVGKEKIDDGCSGAFVPQI